MDRFTLKGNARSQLRGNIGVLFVCTLIVGLITAVCAALSYGIASLLVVPPFELGMTMIYLGLTEGREAKIEKVFNGFKVNFVKSILLYLLMSIFIALWSLLLVIPGIIKGFSYAMAPYILAENPEMSPLDAITQSKRMMHGHKFDLFVLYLSFIAWIFLVYITLGIAAIYVGPYMELTVANFYKSLSGGYTNTYQGTATETASSDSGAFYEE